MYLEKASAKVFRHELKIIALERYKKSLKNFLIKTELPIMDGEKLFKEINRIDREIKKKNKKISDAIRLEHEKLT